MQGRARFFSIVVVFFMSLSVAFGQSSTGSVQGIVSDPTGGVAPGVSVTLSNVATQFDTKTLTNDTGFYTFVAVPPGSYTLKAELTGFKVVHVAAFTLNVNQVITQNIGLTLGEVTDTLEVQAETPLLQAATAELGTVIGTEAIRGLPLNGRNFTQMLLLTKGVSPVQTQQGSNRTTGFGADSALLGSKFVRPSVNGQWNRMNMWLMDGVLNYAPLNSGYAILPSLDAAQEFKVQTQNDKAEFGGVLGAVVNMATSSGTSGLHGSVFNFLRNQVFNARNPFTDIVLDPETGRFEGPGKFNQNQFGATIGGPVYLPKLYDGRRRSFFFLSYDGWRYRRASSSLYRVPTPEELAGDFSGWEQPIFDPATTQPDPNDPSLLTRTPFSNNIIPPDRINPMMRNYMEKYFDKPNITGVDFYNVLNNESIANDANSWQVRIDHQLSDRTNLFARYNDFNNSTKTPLTLGNRFLTDYPRKQAVFALNQNISAPVLLQLRVAWSRVPETSQAEDRPDSATLIQEGWVGAERFGDPTAYISLLGSPSLYYSLEQPTQVVQYSGDLSWVRGRHEFKFGGLFTRTNDRTSEHGSYYYFAEEQTGDPQRIGATGVGVASALLGLPESYSAEGGATGLRYTTLGFYAQDSWKVTSNLALNLSVRWDASVPPKHTAFGGGNFDIRTGDYLIAGQTLPPPCSPTQGAPCIPGDGTLASIPGGEHIRLADRPNLWFPDYNNFGPRIGVAWQFKPKTVLRAGASIAYDVFSAVLQQLTDTQFRWPSSFICDGPANQFGEPLVPIDQVVGTCSSYLVAPDPWFTDSGHDSRKQRAQSYQYHLEFQRELGNNFAASIAYVGSLNRRLDYGPPINSALFPGPGTAEQVNARRPFPYMPYAPKYMTDDGRGHYNAMQLELNRRFSDGLMFLVSYTWSKTIDNGSSGFFGSSEAGPTGALQNPYDRRVDRSVSSQHVPHILSVSGTWEIPAGKGKRRLQSGPAAWILGNWRLSFIQMARSGQPWNPRLSGDIANVGITDTNYMRPNLVGDPEPAERSAERWVNREAFAIPQFSYGNLGRNTFRTDAVFTTDLTLSKDFQISEGTRLEFRAESFNLFNVMNYGVPVAVVQQSNFGQVRTLAELPRQFQFGLRLTF